MKYFVTGATGFIGSYVVKRLVEQGHEVNALCRSESKASDLPEEVKVFLGDINTESEIHKGMEGCDFVYHLAAFAKVWAKDSGQFYKVNVAGTKLVLQAAKDLGIRKVVVVSTAGIYGASFDGLVDESFVRRKDFFNEYEGSKALAESWVKDYVTEGLDVVLVSPTRVYGLYLSGSPESLSLLILKFVRGGWRYLPGPPDRIGNYVFVEDIVDGMELALNRGKPGRTYILGGENHSYKEFFTILSEVTGIKRKMIQIPVWFSFFFAWIQLLAARLFGIDPLITPKWVPKAKYHWAVSSARAEKELGYRITSLRDGLKRTVEALDR